MKSFKYVMVLCSMLVFSSCIDEQVIVDNTPKPLGMIVISSVPPGAQIFFLGTDIKKITPDSIGNLESGVFDVTLKLNGYRDTTIFVTVLNNHRTTKQVTLSELAVGSIHVASDPQGAQIYLAGKNTNKVTPDSLVNINPGIYDLSLHLSGFRDTSITVAVEKRKVALTNVMLQDTLPELKVNIGYSRIQFGQLLFSFEFTRNIKLDEIITEDPKNSITTTEFDNEDVELGEERIIIFNSSEKGAWTFTIKGEKTDGDKRIFEKRQSVNVE